MTAEQATVQVFTSQASGEEGAVGMDRDAY